MEPSHDGLYSARIRRTQVTMYGVDRDASLHSRLPWPDLPWTSDVQIFTLCVSFHPLSLLLTLMTDLTCSRLPRSYMRRRFAPTHPQNGSESFRSTIYETPRSPSTNPATAGSFTSSEPPTPTSGDLRERASSRESIRTTYGSSTSPDQHDTTSDWEGLSLSDPEVQGESSGLPNFNDATPNHNWEDDELSIDTLEQCDRCGLYHVPSRNQQHRCRDLRGSCLSSSLLKLPLSFSLRFC